MNERDAVVAAPSVAKGNLKPACPRSLPVGLAVVLVVLLSAFSRSLLDLARFAVHSDLYSYILLVPFISFYLIWMKRTTISFDGTPNRTLGLVILAAGASVLLGYGLARQAGWHFAREDSLAYCTLSFVVLLLGACSWFLAWRAFRSVIFPLGFLLFMTPFPVAVMSALEIFMQYGSAAVAHILFKVSGTTVFYQDLHFQLPRIDLHVAPECSGIRSSLVLLIVSVVTGHIFLKSSIGCAMLTLAVIPLALVRNGFRIFTIGELCNRVGPEMIDSYIHRRGGPIFFALSLIPFFLLLILLMKTERSARRKKLQPTAH